MNKRTGKSKFLTSLIFLGDLFLINFVICFLSFIGLVPSNNDITPIFRQIILVLNVSYIPVLNLIKLQHEQRFFEMERMIRLAFYAVVFHFTFFYTLINFLYIPNLPIGFLFTYYAILYVLISCWWVAGRVILKEIRIKGFNYRNIVIIGAGKNGVELANTIQETGTNGRPCEYGCLVY